MKWILSITIKDGQPAIIIEGLTMGSPRNVRGCLKGVSDLYLIINTYYSIPIV